MSIFTPAKSLLLRPLRIRFNGDLEAEAWHADVVAGMNSVRGVKGAPSAGSLFSVTSQGEVVVFDPIVAEESGLEPEVKKLDGQFSQDIPVEGMDMPVVAPLENGFVAGSVISMTLKMGENLKR